MCVVVALVAGLGSPLVRAADVLVGAVWQVNYKNPNTGMYQSFGLIRCTTDGKVFLDGKEVGTHKNSGLDAVEIEIANATNPGINGISKATKVAKNGTIWEGTHKHKDGRETPIRMFLKKD
jgi:hypothetical protein